MTPNGIIEEKFFQICSDCNNNRIVSDIENGFLGDNYHFGDYCVMFGIECVYMKKDGGTQ